MLGCECGIRESMSDINVGNVRWLSRLNSGFQSRISASNFDLGNETSQLTTEFTTSNQSQCLG